MKKPGVRQGDVYLINLTKIGQSIPESGTVVKRDYVVIAEGEATGHMHAVKGNVEEIAADGLRYLRVYDRVDLTHQEHGVIPLEQGDYQILTPKREYSPTGERVVKD